jgi:hypothetical protein
MARTEQFLNYEKWSPNLKSLIVEILSTFCFWRVIWYMYLPIELPQSPVLPLEGISSHVSGRSKGVRLGPDLTMLTTLNNGAWGKYLSMEWEQSPLKSWCPLSSPPLLYSPWTRSCYCTLYEPKRSQTAIRTRDNVTQEIQSSEKRVRSIPS